MTETRSIEIDLEVHKLIEMERRSFSEKSNDALRRLLGLDERCDASSGPEPAGRPWQSKGVTLPHGTKLRMEYNGLVHSGEIVDGKWIVEGQTFKSPSGAASGVALTKDGSKTAVDGWYYWYVKRPGDHEEVWLQGLREHTQAGS